LNRWKHLPFESNANVKTVERVPQKKRIKKGEDTLPETNIAPENGWLEALEDVFPFGMAYFRVRTVSFREGT